jgi:Ca-activated chloride channel homolog
MIRFGHSIILYLLWLIPALVVLYWYVQKNQNKLLEKFTGTNLHKILFPERSLFKSAIKFGVFLFGLTLLIIAVADPQIGTKIEDVKQVGIDVYILLDVSRSMAAEDIKPSRLEKAKYEISRLMQKLEGDRLGLVVFAGQAFIQFPLTSDYSAATLFLNAVDLNSVPAGGTNIGAAFELALKSFRYDDGTKKAIVVITDGEDHEGNIESAISEANSKDVSVYAIGLGSPTGSPIPIYNDSGNQIGYKKDNQGQVVLTKLDEETLKSLAAKGNGKYYRGTNSEDELDQIYTDLGKIQESEYGSKKITEYEDRFYYFLFPALLILLAEFMMTSKRTKWLDKFEQLRKGEVR